MYKQFLFNGRLIDNWKTNPSLNSSPFKGIWCLMPFKDPGLGYNKSYTSFATSDIDRNNCKIKFLENSLAWIVAKVIILKQPTYFLFGSRLFPQIGECLKMDPNFPENQSILIVAIIIEVGKKHIKGSWEENLLQNELRTRLWATSKAILSWL